METDKLIKDLTNEVEPVKRIGGTFSRLASWFLASILCVGAGVALFGLRPDANIAASTTLFYIEAAILIMLAVLSAAGAFILSVPATEKSSLQKCFPLIPLTLWAGTILYAVISEYEESGIRALNPGHGMVCLGEMFLFGALPGLFIFLMVKKAAPTKLGWTGFLATLAALAMAALTLQFTCSASSSTHIMVWHVAPVIVIGCIGIWLGKRVLRW